MGNQTPLYAAHCKANAKIVDFSGWNMPLHYGSQIQEHHQVRQQAGMFDVSHMGIVDLRGSEVTLYLRILLANNVDRLADGKALYTCMLNEEGGVIDDLIVYKINDDFYRLVINAGRRQKDIEWMHSQLASFDVELTERNDLAMLALQGPAVKSIIEKWLPDYAQALLALKPFTFAMVDDAFFARTGYTGEDGYEIMMPADKAESYWNRLLALGAAPCGLGARDTLRLEAGLNLYGSDMDEGISPLEANLAWTVALDPADRHFIGRSALEKLKQDGIKRRLVGLVLEGPGIMRNHAKVKIEGNGEGEVTSGGYSPTLEKSIGLARIPVDVGEQCLVEIRNKTVPAKIIKPPFVRHGKKMF